MTAKTKGILLKQLTINERINERQATKNLRVPLSLYKRTFNVLSQTIAELFDEFAKKPHDKCKVALGIIIFRILGTLQSIQILATKGYYFESNILIRNYYESIGLCIYLKENPEKVDDWLKGKTNLLPTSTAFKLVAKIFKSENNEQLEKLATKTYGKLCNYVHGNFFVNIDSVYNRQEKTFELPSRLRQNEINGIAYLSMGLLWTILHVFEDDLSNSQISGLNSFILSQIEEFMKLSDWSEPIV